MSEGALPGAVPGGGGRGRRRVPVRVSLRLHLAALPPDGPVTTVRGVWREEGYPEHGAEWDGRG
eukprot:6208647-Pyramimonas_sp.AAC.1